MYGIFENVWPSLDEDHDNEDLVFSYTIVVMFCGWINFL